MADVTITIPDDLVALYIERAATHNADAARSGAPRWPPPTRAALERVARDYLKNLIRDESLRLDPGDGSLYDADEAATRGA